MIEPIMRAKPARADSKPGVFVGDGETGIEVTGCEASTVIGTVVGAGVGGVVITVARFVG
jgi:hypothetical protein